jgi:hypothetical protein
MDPSEHLQRIAQLEARVAALEAALRRRSAQLRRIQQVVCPQDLAVIAGLLEAPEAAAGAPSDPDFLAEAPVLRPAQVHEALDELWRSTPPPEQDAGHG